jgi:hypothetical protein
MDYIQPCLQEALLSCFETSVFSFLSEAYIIEKKKLFMFHMLSIYTAEVQQD